MKLLLTGAGGQLGRETAALAAARGLGLVALDRAGLDIADAGAVAGALAQHRPDIVINAAAYTAVDRAETEPDLARAINAAGPEVLARACARQGAGLVHVSTDYVFDGTKAGAYVESDPLAPLGVYGRTKAEGEARLRDALDRHVILRTSWVYGVHGHNFLKTMLRLAGERDRLTVVADQHGCPTATPDIASALLAAGEALVAGREVAGTYHFAGTGVTSWHGFAGAIIDEAAPLTGRRPEVAAITTADYPTPARRPANSELSSDRFAEVFGLRAMHWRERVREVVHALLGQGAASQSQPAEGTL
ncbi:dTDP-4-dehydrorhamnose reductase [Ancylobacter sp. A5.8]|uniref:dTDP-4-dehydrorhamnose reductase n=1 Tax=Ancylobacter gelatini TaxID=2919920 RepID=UPI001F4E82B7|nr:dTDP-4-dehydrorhamnose reductase [Ancylobacter gelatini]MCJ8142801.1 dTDP-4-dehydrorhamnose reductase [Ancylobacter gelatini]